MFPTYSPSHNISFSSLFLPVLYVLFIALFSSIPPSLSLASFPCFFGHPFTFLFLPLPFFILINEERLYEEPFSEGFVVSWYTDCTLTLLSLWHCGTINIKVSICNHQLINYWKLSFYAFETTNSCVASFIHIVSFVKTFQLRSAADYLECWS